MGYMVRTPVFEGPLDLLLHLAVREEVEVWDVSLSEIVDGFVAHLVSGAAVDLETTTEFLVVAATLIELKSRRLLPDAPDLEIDEDFAPWEERDLLLARLLECRTFAAVALVLEDVADAAARSFPRSAGMEERFLAVTPDLLEGVTPNRLRDAFVRATTPRPLATVDVAHMTTVKASVVDAVVELTAELPRLGRTTFRDLTRGLGGRLQVIVRFLALLELYRQGLVHLDQAETFGEIAVDWTGNDQEPVRAVLVDAYDG